MPMLRCTTPSNERQASCYLERSARHRLAASHPVGRDACVAPGLLTRDEAFPNVASTEHSKYPDEGPIADEVSSQVAAKAAYTDVP